MDGATLIVVHNTTAPDVDDVVTEHSQRAKVKISEYKKINKNSKATIHSPPHPRLRVVVGMVADG